MLVLVEEGLGVDVSRVGFRAEAGPVVRVVARVLEALERGEKVVAYYRGAWRDYAAIAGRARARGLNHLLYHPVDSREAALTGGLVPQEALVTARASFHAASKAGQALARASPSKRLSRGDLVRRPVASMLEYSEAPLLVHPEACAAQRHCTACVTACPVEAISGKPPRVNAEACTSCGLCVAACPYTLLETPTAGLPALEYLMDGVRRATGEPLHLVFACTSSMDAALSALEPGRVHAVVFAPVQCPGWATQYHVLAAVARGFHVTVYCDGGRAGECGGAREVDEWLSELEGLPVTPGLLTSPGELAEALSRPPRARVLAESPTRMERTRLAALVAGAYGVERLDFHSPITGVVEVDESRCMLCEACSSTCPYGALETVVVGDRVRLVFHHDRCPACLACEAVCPYRAIRVRYAYDSRLAGAVTVLAEDQVARCRRCGAPLGAMRMIKATEEALRRSGASEWVIRQLWLCPNCKIYGLRDEGGG